MPYLKTDLKLTQSTMLNVIKRAHGTHAIAELSNRMPDVLNDLEHIHEIVVEAVERMVDTNGRHELQVTNVATAQRPREQGVSVVVSLTVGHVAVHTVPQRGYATIDVLVLGLDVDVVEPLFSIDRNLI